MAKRFTDTEKWKKQFFKGLSQWQMLFWNFINDDCDHSGVWYVDLEVASLRIKENINGILYEAIEAFNRDEERVFLFDSGKKLLIKGFMAFQYGENPSENNRLHKAALETLRRHKIESYKGVITPLEQVKGKVMGKDKDIILKGCGETLRGEPEKNFDQLSAFNEFFEKYPARGRLKRSASLRVYTQAVLSRDIASRILKSLGNYSAHLEANDWKLPQESQNWIAEWHEWEHHDEQKKLEPWQVEALKKREALGVTAKLKN